MIFSSQENSLDVCVEKYAEIPHRITNVLVFSLEETRKDLAEGSDMNLKGPIKEMGCKFFR
ncbi:MAG: hypothetical protein QW424_01740 [Candidatus Bathyarchaeia archaeon]